MQMTDATWGGSGSVPPTSSESSIVKLPTLSPKPVELDQDSLDLEYKSSEEVPDSVDFSFEEDIDAEEEPTVYGSVISGVTVSQDDVGGTLGVDAAFSSGTQVSLSSYKSFNKTDGEVAVSLSQEIQDTEITLDLAQSYGEYSSTDFGAGINYKGLFLDYAYSSFDRSHLGSAYLTTDLTARLSLDQVASYGFSPDLGHQFDSDTRFRYALKSDLDMESGFNLGRASEKWNGTGYAGFNKTIGESALVSGTVSQSFGETIGTSVSLDSFWMHAGGDLTLAHSATVGYVTASEIEETGFHWDTGLNATLDSGHTYTDIYAYVGGTTGTRTVGGSLSQHVYLGPVDLGVGYEIEKPWDDSGILDEAPLHNINGSVGFSIPQNNLLKYGANINGTIQTQFQGKGNPVMTGSVTLEIPF